MSSITLKDIPPGLHSFYKTKAKRNARSLSAEIFAALEKEADYVSDDEGLSLDQVGGCLQSKLDRVPTDDEMKKAIASMLVKKWK